MSDEKCRTNEDCLKSVLSTNGASSCSSGMISQVDLKETASTTSMARTTTTIISPASATFQAPSIAVTASTGSSAITTKRSGGKRATKIEFVRFDSVETIFKQSDHDDVIQCAKIKDEIKRFVDSLISFVFSIPTKFHYFFFTKDFV